MSTTPSPTSQTSTAPSQQAAASRGSHASARKTDGAPGADLFANLLSLVGDTRGASGQEATLLAASTEDGPASTPADDAAGPNPLLALMDWADLPAMAATRTSGTGPGSGPDAPEPGTRQTFPTGASQATDGQGVDVARLGMSPVAPSGTLDTAAAARLEQAVAATGPEQGSAVPAAVAGAVTRAAGPASAAQRAQAQAINGRRIGAGNPSLAPAHGSNPPDSTRNLQALHASQVRSTVALDRRFGLTQAEAAPLPPAASNGTAASPGSLTGSRLSGEAVPSPTVESHAGTSATDHNASDHLEALDEDGTRQPDAAGEAGPETVSHWSTQHLRHASLRVGQGGEDAIDIQLSLSGQEVRVDFRTDSADVRASLQQGADQTLGDLLQRSGMQLGGVSVGAQGQPSGREPSPGGEPSKAGARRPPERNEPVAAAPVRPRSDGSRPLDVFA